MAAAKAFFHNAIQTQRRCRRTITLDGYAASHRAVHELKADGSLPANTKLRSSKYLTNLIEPDRPFLVFGRASRGTFMNANFRITCQGLFDTVGALGIPLRRFRLYNRDR